MIFLVVDGGYRGPLANAGVGAALVESSGRASDLFVPDGEVLACAAMSVLVGGNPAMEAEFQAALVGARWATARLGSSVGGLLVLSDNTNVVARVRERAGWNPRWIISFLPRAHRLGRTPHNLTHWLASAAQSYRAGWITEFDGRPPAGEIERLIDAGPLAPNNYQTRRRAADQSSRRLTRWAGMPEVNSADDWTFAGAIYNRLRAA